MQKKLTLSILFLALNFLMSAQKEKISLTIMCRSEYCGGARPSPKMVEDAQKLKPYANQMLMIVSEKFKVDSVKTNDKGELNFKIKPGTYKIFEAWKFYKLGCQGLEAAKFERECLKMEWNQELYRINKVGKKKASIENGMEIMIRCEWGMPCMRPENVHHPE
jgi:hypothetical protein